MKPLTRNWFELLSKRAANRRGSKLFWLVLVLVLVLLNSYSPAEPTITEQLLASVMIIIAAGAIWRWIYRGHGEPQFGFFPILLIVYSLQYALPVFTVKAYTMQYLATQSLPDSAMEKALVIALLGLIGILFGYYYPGSKRIARSLPTISMTWRSAKVVRLVSLGFAGLGLFVFVVTFRMQLSPAVQAFVNWPSAFFYLAIIALLILQLEGVLGWGYVVLLWCILIPAHMTMGLAQGILGFGIQDAAALLITYVTMKRRIPWTMFAIGFAAFFFIQPIKASLRAQVFKGGWVNNEQDQSEKLEALFSVGAQGLTVIELFDPGDLLSIAMQRLASIVVLATVVDRTPQDIPYWGGSTYAEFLLIPIPRLLYPDKPQILPGNVFGHKYGIIQPDDYRTSINTMQLLELYGNFGILGAILGSVLIGMLYRTVNDFFLHPGAGLGALVGGIFVLNHLIDIENAAVSVFGGLLMQSVTVLAFHAAIRFVEGLLQAQNQRRAIRRMDREAHLEVTSEQIQSA